MRWWVVLFLWSCSLTAAELPHYDPEAQPDQELATALAEARQGGRKVLLLFGSEWCQDCRSLNRRLMQAPLKHTLADAVVVVHVDVGNWDRNQDFAARYDHPEARGIPALALLDADGRTLMVTRAGELANVSSMGNDALNDWFKSRLRQFSRRGPETAGSR